MIRFRSHFDKRVLDGQDQDKISRIGSSGPVARFTPPQGRCRCMSRSRRLKIHRKLDIYNAAGIPLPRATPTAARVMKRDAELGSIAPGKLADMILVNGDPTINIKRDTGQAQSPRKMRELRTCRFTALLVKAFYSKCGAVFALTAC